MKMLQNLENCSIRCRVATCRDPTLDETGSSATSLVITEMKVKIHREGTNILIILLLMLMVINVPAWLFIRPLAIPVVFLSISAVFYLLVLNFFRSPRRHFKGDPERVVVASADGTVVACEETYEGEYLHRRVMQVSIFMSSTENERSSVAIRALNGQDILMRQIAGAVARRIVTYARPGDRASIEEHMGFIKFGSRVDIYLPLDAEIFVKVVPISPTPSHALTCCRDAWPVYSHFRRARPSARSRPTRWCSYSYAPLRSLTFATGRRHACSVHIRRWARNLTR